MILFQEDWLRYPDATIDLDTRNRSFVDICYILEDMGIQNNLWPLALHNKHLVGVDPFDPMLSFEYKGMITQECFDNPWYYFREIARIPVQGAMQPSPVLANRGNLALWWSYFNHITTFLIQPRQTGKSVNIASLDRYLLNFGLVHSSIHLLTKEDQLRRNDIERLKEYEEVLPPYLRRSIPKKDPNNQEYIYLSALENKYETHVPRMDEKGAYKVGRGFTSANIRIDEFAYISWLKATLTTILSTTNAAFVSARENNAHHGIILATTAGKKDDRDGSYAYEILTNSFPFTDQIYDAKNHADLKKMIEATSQNGFAINCTFSHRMLGISDQQHYENIKKAMISGEEADRDYFNIWTSGGRGSPLSTEQLNTLRENQREDFIAEIDPKTRYLTKWYVSLKVRDQIMEEGNIALGIDPSQAQGKDEIGMQYVDLTTLEVIGTCYVNMTNIIDYSLWLYDILMKWPKLVAVIECKNTGPAIIDQLCLKFRMTGQNAFKRLFNRIVQDPDKYRDILEEIRRADKYVLGDLYTKYKSYFGYNTSGSGENARSILYGQVLQNAVRHGMDRVNDIKTIDQILALEVKNGRVDHPKGQHDDGCVAWLLACYLAMFGQNLSYYGIDHTQVMSSTLVKKSLREMSHFEIQQRQLREDIQALVQKLAGTQDHFVQMRLEAEIGALVSRVVEEEGETFSVSDMIKKTREEKRIGYQKGSEKNLLDGVYRKVVDSGSTVY